MTARVPGHLADYVESLDPHKGLWIDGVPSAPSGGGTFEVLDPATGEPITAVADGAPRHPAT
jgi:hypothetical protein